MAFLRSSSIPDGSITLRGRGVWLRAPSMGDYAPWAELRAQSRDYLTPWEPIWQRDELSRSAFRLINHLPPLKRRMVRGMGEE